MLRDEYIRNCTVIRVVDGDTVEVMVDSGFRQYHRQHIRLDGINAPETRGPERPEGLKAKEFLADYIPPGAKLILKSNLDTSFARYVGRLFTPAGEDINQLLVNAGHAELV